MEETAEKCYNCGAIRPKTRRRQASTTQIRRSAADADRMLDDEILGKSARVGASRPPVEPTGDTGGSRRASARQAAAPERPRRAGKSRPMQPIEAAPAMAMQATAPMIHREEPADPEVPRMIRRHAYQAIRPETHGYDHVKWLRMCIGAVVSVVVLVLLIYLFLRYTMPGQRLLAANGREASMEAYHEIGRMYMVDGSISRAIWALEIAQAKDPDNLEVLIDLGKAYMGNNDRENAEIAYTRAINMWPAYPEPYRLLATNMLEQDRNYEAVQLVELAIEKTEDSYFNTMYTQLLPSLPSTSKLGGRSEEEFDITLSAEEGATIYYTEDGTDPLINGKVYVKGQLIHLEEGSTKIRAVAEKGGMYSKEQTQSYIIVKPSPDMPKASLAPGTYKNVRTVSLRGGKNETFYYTIDGTAPYISVEGESQPSPTAKLFDPENPITLRVGKTQLRAIAVNGEGKISNELVVEYKCEGRTNASMTEKDTIDKLRLMSTTRATFEETYGAPLEERSDGENLLGKYTKLIYSFGYATFLDRGGDKAPVLVELSFNSTAFNAPRDTKIGSRMDDVIAAFRDEGGEFSANGDRVLYTLTDGRIGLLTKISDTEYTVGYFQKQSNGQFVELTYHITNGLVDRIDWLQYETN